jgi:serine protease Do
LGVQISAAGDLRKAEESLQGAMTKLNATPLTLQTPVFSRYKYDLASVKARKLMTVHYYIIDKVEKTLFKSSFDVAEEKSFEVAYQVHEDDPDKKAILSKNSSEADVVAWEEAPSTVKLSQLVAHYTDHAGATQALPPLAELRRDMLRDRNTALAKYRSETFDARPLNDARFDHVVVVVNPEGRLGSRFFVKPDVVLTNWHVVEGAKFVEMTMYDGQETFGKVMATDARLDLALVRVQSRGKPVTFYTENRLDLGQTVEAIGHPEHLKFSITRGVISAIRKHNYTEGKPVLYIQTDTPINHGNSGGPLFLGDKVIGLNTWGKDKKIAEGLNFAVHYSEILNFLREYLPSFQVSEHRP